MAIKVLTEQGDEMDMEQYLRMKQRERKMKRIKEKFLVFGGRMRKMGVNIGTQIKQAIPKAVQKGGKSHAFIGNFMKNLEENNKRMEKILGGK